MECLHEGNRVVKVSGQLLDVHPAPFRNFTISIQRNSGNPIVIDTTSRSCQEVFDNAASGQPLFHSSINRETGIRIP
jgi:hypothetical protein